MHSLEVNNLLGGLVKVTQEYKSIDGGTQIRLNCTGYNYKTLVS